VFALKLRHHMEITIGFDAGTAPTEAVRRSLEALADGAGLLTAAGAAAAGPVS
jgi:hypothetical protein